MTREDFTKMRTEPKTWNLEPDTESLGAVVISGIPVVVIEPVATAHDPRTDDDICVMAKETRYFNPITGVEGLKVILPSTCGHWDHHPEQGVYFSMS